MSRVGDAEVEEVARGSGYPSGKLRSRQVCAKKRLISRSPYAGILKRLDRSRVWVQGNSPILMGHSQGPIGEARGGM